MTDLELKRALNAYTQKGADRERALKKELMASLPACTPRGSGFGRLVAAAAVLVLAVSLVGFTQPGRAFAVAVGERVMGLIETVFPPKEVVVAPEGDPEVVTHMPHGDEPVLDPEGPEGAVVPGYVIYVDEDIYTTTETEGRMEIVPLDPPVILGDNGEPVPPCMLTVEHRPELAFAGVEETISAELAARCTDVRPTEGAQTEEGVICLSAWDGLDWDSLCMDIRIVDDGQGGVYVLTAQYFMEATEGHGTRFSAMMDTFRLLE